MSFIAAIMIVCSDSRYLDELDSSRGCSNFRFT